MSDTYKTKSIPCITNEHGHQLYGTKFQFHNMPDLMNETKDLRQQLEQAARLGGEVGPVTCKTLAEKIRELISLESFAIRRECRFCHTTTCDHAKQGSELLEVDDVNRVLAEHESQAHPPAPTQGEPEWLNRLNSCEFHGDDHEACTKYSGQVPCSSAQTQGDSPKWLNKLNLCEHHGDDFEACANYSGQVPCSADSGEVEPVITNEMKAECIGEFSFMVDVPCGECLIEGEDEDCEVCGGELTHEKAVTVPWDTCKKIYKTMAKFDPSRATHPPVPTQGVPEGRVAIPRDVAEAHGMYLIGYSWLKHNAPDELNHPSGEWVRCDERLPKLTGNYCIAIADPDDIGWSSSVSWTAFWSGECWEDCDPVEDGQPVTHWQPMPQPPKGKQEGE